MRIPFRWGILSIASLLACHATSYAGTITVNYQAQPGQRNVVGAQGAAVADGNEVRIGYFAAGFDVLANAEDLASLGGAWIGYRSDDPNRFIRTLSGQTGRFTSSASGEAGTFPGQKIYLWIFETTDASAPNSSFSNVLSYGLYSATDPNWAFPSDEISPNGITVTSDQVNEAFHGSFDADSLRLETNSSAPATLTYADWKASNFSATTPESERGPEDNPDDDELNNALEYLIGSNPEVSTPSPLTSFQSEGSLIVTFPRSIAVPMGTDQIEVSEDLKDWDPVPDGTVSISDLNELQRLITVTLPFADLNRQFMQISVDVSGP